jgi:hypothetical protein
LVSISGEISLEGRQAQNNNKARKYLELRAVGAKGDEENQQTQPAVQNPQSQIFFLDSVRNHRLEYKKRHHSHDFIVSVSWIVPLYFHIKMSPQNWAHQDDADKKRCRYQ